MITIDKAIKIMSSGFGWSSEEHRQIIELLKQQEKIEKLLELYQKRDKRKSVYYWHKDTKQIKELEEELK